MKKMIKAAEQHTKIKVIYAEALSGATPTLRTMTVDGDSLRSALLTMLEHMDIEVEDVEEREAEDILEDITYYNEATGDNNYIFLLEVNGDTVIDNTEPEENYHS